MQIQYFGLSSFKISTKDATIITDPFDKQSGLTPPRGSADLLILAEKSQALYNATSGISGEPFLVNDPGEYDVKGVIITGIPLKQDEGRFVTVFLIEAEDIKILNLAHIREFTMNEDDLEGLGEIDILIVPVGSNSVMSAKDAAKVVNEVEPKIVIPSHYQISGLSLPYEKVDTFIKEMGGKSENMEKLSLKKKELVPEQIKIITLEPLRWFKILNFWVRCEAQPSTKRGVTFSCYSERGTEAATKQMTKNWKASHDLVRQCSQRFPWKESPDHLDLYCYRNYHSHYCLGGYVALSKTTSERY